MGVESLYLCLYCPCKRVSHVKGSKERKEKKEERNIFKTPRFPRGGQLSKERSRTRNRRINNASIVTPPVQLPLDLE